MSSPEVAFEVPVTKLALLVKLDELSLKTFPSSIILAL